MSSITLLLLNIDDEENSPIERVEIIRDILDAIGDLFPEVVRPIVIPILQEMYDNFIKIGDTRAVEYIKSLCEVYDISLSRKDPRPTPYEDKESVHVFMQDTREVIDWLIKNYPPQKYTRMFDHPFIDFIERTFIPVVEDFTLIDIFTSVCRYIEYSDHEDELKKILLKEMDLAQNSCVSGHLSAMINTLMGFPGVPECKGSNFEHKKAEVFHYLNKSLDFSEIGKSLEKSIEEAVNGDGSPIKDLTKQELVRILKDYTRSGWEVGENNKVFSTN